MDWFEIFKVGKHTDSSGKTREWTLKDLQEIASSYKPQEHEAPIVIGHPEMDSPAYGWIEALKTEGDKLLAKPKQVVDQLKDWVRKGLYKKVSIAIYPDLTLRHVGFLGGTPPAIKGLKEAVFGDKKPAWVIEGELDMKFEDKTCSHMNPDDTFVGGFDGCVEHMMSCEGHDEDSARKICAYIGRKAGKIHSDQKGGTIMYEWLIKMKEAIGLAEKQLTPDPSVKFTEADIQAKVQEAKDQTFAEAQKKIEAEKKEKDEALKKLKEIEDQKRKGDIASFCEALCKDGKLTPALRKIVEPIMIAVAADETQIEFSEGVKKSKLGGIKDFLAELPKVVTFKDVAGGAGPGVGSDDEKRKLLINQFMEKNPKAKYKEAVITVARQNPDLFKDI